MPRRIHIAVRPDGSIAAEVSGTPGPGCLDAIDQLRTMLHAEVEVSRPTPEFSMPVLRVRIDASIDEALEDRA